MPVPPRRRITINSEANSALEDAFLMNARPSREDRKVLARNLNLHASTVSVWYREKRAFLRRQIYSKPRKLTMERVLSLSEGISNHRRVHDASYHPNHTTHIYDHMLSSPTPSPPSSPSKSALLHRNAYQPPSKHFDSQYRPFEGIFLKEASLDWACAHASRHAPSTSPTPPPLIEVEPELHGLAGDESGTEAGDDHEAITPHSSLFLPGQHHAAISSLEPTSSQSFFSRTIPFSSSSSSVSSGDTMVQGLPYLTSRFGPSHSLRPAVRLGKLKEEGEDPWAEGQRRSRTVRNAHLYPLRTEAPRSLRREKRSIARRARDQLKERVKEREKAEGDTAAAASIPPLDASPLVSRADTTQEEVDAAMVLCGLFQS